MCNASGEAVFYLVACIFDICGESVCSVKRGYQTPKFERNDLKPTNVDPFDAAAWMEVSVVGEQGTVPYLHL